MRAVKRADRFFIADAASCTAAGTAIPLFAVMHECVMMHPDREDLGGFGLRGAFWAL